MKTKKLRASKVRDGEDLAEKATIGYNDAGSRVREFEIRWQLKEGVFDERVEGHFIR